MAACGDIVIVGGGVIGLSTAYYLAGEGARVVVLDKEDLGREASWAGAGILPPGNSDMAQSPFDRLRSISAAAFPQLSAELHETTGIDNGYLRCGGMEFPPLEATAAPEEWRGAGIRVEELTAAEARKLEPALGCRSGTVWRLPDLAQVRNPRHLKALVAACAKRNVDLRASCPVQEFVIGAGRVQGARTASGEVRGGTYLLAAGAWSGRMLEQIGWRPVVYPVRGQIALLNPGKPLVRHVLMRGPQYLVPRGDGLILVGSTEEHAGFEKRTTAGAIAQLLELACDLVPSLREASLERTWSGLRPGSPDGLPFLGRVPGIDNLFIAAGHFRAGLQLSPGTGMLLRDLMLGRRPPLDPTPFRLDRPLPAGLT